MLFIRPRATTKKISQKKKAVKERTREFIGTLRKYLHNTKGSCHSGIKVKNETQAQGKQIAKLQRPYQ